ncbi:hypothetical protein EV368DRAFT_80160 [Lentinula lateritia]|nr:hypothetical protein EV368DRAFT_80160 [Lentinula lateritia]
MGSLCSKPSTHSGGHTVLGSTSDHNNGASRTNEADPRAAAAEAAERRLKAVSFLPQSLLDLFSH